MCCVGEMQISGLMFRTRKVRYSIKLVHFSLFNSLFNWCLVDYPGTGTGYPTQSYTFILSSTQDLTHNFIINPVNVLGTAVYQIIREQDGCCLLFSCFSAKKASSSC